MVSKLKTTAYPALLFPSRTKLLPSVYQISLGLVRRSFDNSSQGFVQWSKVSRQEWKGREPSGVVRKMAGLRTSQGDIVRPGFSISTAWYLRFLWSDIHKWPLPLAIYFIYGKVYVSMVFFTGRWMDKEVVLHMHNGTLFSYKREVIWVSSNEVDEPRAYYTEWSQKEKGPLYERDFLKL